MILYIFVSYKCILKAYRWKIVSNYLQFTFFHKLHRIYQDGMGSKVDIGVYSLKLNLIKKLETRYTTKRVFLKSCVNKVIK